MDFNFLFLHLTDASLDMQVVYSSELVVNDLVYARTACKPIYYYYEAIEINVMETGYYIIISNSTIDTYGSIYENNFNVLTSRMNLLLEDDNSACNHQFKLIIRLQVNTTYILVVSTTFSNVTGAFSVLVFGPNNVSMNYISE